MVEDTRRIPPLLWERVDCEPDRIFVFMIMVALSADLSPGLGRFLIFVVFPGTALVAVVTFGANLVTGDYVTSGISLMSGQAK